ncbi:MAG: hypothetical protein JWM81_1116 [Candidatus Saccharibacteria bacterium]|nr:hypothetical protein [Candidatus Saccharibacteria bacterium]
MSELLQAVLSDQSVRSENMLPVAAAKAADKFNPWATKVD